MLKSLRKQGLNFRYYVINFRYYDINFNIIIYVFCDYQIAVETILNIQTVATLGKEESFYNKYMEAVSGMYK
jgi:hypothetical protein